MFGGCTDYKEAIRLVFKLFFDYKQIIETDSKYLNDYFAECQ